jgi:hypothetical protein
MDNSVDLPGYKFYVDADSGERPAVFVTFLDLVEDGSSNVNGVLFPVDAGELAVLDGRERNYVRREVTGRVDADGRVWAYLGSGDARERYETGCAGGTAVVGEEYLSLVRGSFAALGSGALERFDQSTDPPEVPVRRLRRIDLPPSG